MACFATRRRPLPRLYLAQVVVPRLTRDRLPALVFERGDRDSPPSFREHARARVACSGFPHHRRTHRQPSIAARADQGVIATKASFAIYDMICSSSPSSCAVVNIQRVEPQVTRSQRNRLLRSRGSRDLDDHRPREQSQCARASTLAALAEAVARHAATRRRVSSCAWRGDRYFAAGGDTSTGRLRRRRRPRRDRHATAASTQFVFCTFPSIAFVNGDALRGAPSWRSHATCASSSRKHASDHSCRWQSRRPGEAPRPVPARRAGAGDGMMRGAN